MRIAYVVGTFSAHPAVMGAMNEFLRWVDNAERRPSCTRRSNQRCADWVAATNQQLADAALPIRVVQPRHGMDGAVQGTEPLQLAAAVLSARRRGHAQLGRHRALLEQHGLYCGGLSRLQAQARRRRAPMKNDGWWLTRRRTSREGESYENTI